MAPADGTAGSTTRTGEVLARVRDTVTGVLAELLPAGTTPDLAASLRAYGLDSMAAARLWLVLQTEYAVDIPIDWVGKSRSFAELADRVAAHLAEGPTTGVSRAAGVLVTADPANAGQPFPLTPMQQAYLLGRQAELTADAVGCHLYREFEVDDLDVTRLDGAWRRLVRHHDVLRLGITASGQQYIRPDAPEWTLRVHEPTGDDAAQERQAAEVRARLSHKRYAAGDTPFTVEVTKRADGTGRVHLSLDAITTDGHGLALLLTQWAALYTDPDHVLPAPAVSVRDSLAALKAQEDSATHAADLDYWVELLRDMPDGPDLGGTGQEGPRRALRDSLSAREWAAIRELAGAWDVSPTSLVLTLFAEVLARYAARAPFSLVVTTNNRVRLPSAVADLVGPFTASAVFLADSTAGVRLDDACARTHKQLWQAVQHSSVCGVTVQRELRSRRAIRRQVALPVVFTSMFDALPADADSGFAASVDYAVSQTSGVALDHQMWQQHGELHLQWDVADAFVAPGVADAAFAALVNDLRELATPPDLEIRGLNELQQAYFVARAGDAAADGCQVVTSLHVPHLDRTRLEAAALKVVAEYDVLRSAVSGDGRIRVRRDTPARRRVPVTEVADPAEHAAVDAATRAAMVSAAFPLARWHHFDLRATRSRAGATIHLAVDLLLADAVSIHAIARELVRVYLDGGDPRPQVPYAEQRAAREHARLAKDFVRRQQHWRDRLADLPPGPTVLDRPRAAAPRTRLTGAFTDWAGFRARAERHGVSPDAVLLAALGKALSSAHPEDFTVSVVRFPEHARRFRPAELTALSWVRRGPEGRSIVEAARAHDAELAADAEADAVSGLTELRKIVLRERKNDSGYGFPVVYTSLFDLTDTPAGARTGEWLTCTPGVSLDCIGEFDATGARFCWDVVEADFADAPALFAGFARLVAALESDDAAWTAGSTDDPVDAWAAERHKILVEWNDTARDFPCDGPIHLPIERQAAATPDAVALRWAGGTQTYGELNAEANRIAWTLKRRGVGPETVVGISMARGPRMIAAALGILKADGVYLPVEPGLPAERAAVMLAEARCSIVLSTSDTTRWPAASSIEVIDTDTAAATGGEVNPVPTGHVDNRAYIIFTSGSTGKPKGVAVTHRPVHNLLNWCHRMFHFGPSDVGLCVTSLGFDLSVFDIFGLLGVGASLYIADAAQQRDPELLLDVLLDEPITFWNSAPTTLNQLAPLLAAKSGHPGTRDLRLVFLSGDYTPLSLPDELRPVFGNAEMISLGGATEATVWSNWFPIGEVDPAWRSIPYGRPIDNARYHVLDENREPVPVGVEGDLYIGGAVLSQGYVNRPDLTAERFVDDPFHPGERLYLTGDRASYFPDGNLCFLGRADNQVKIRGFRVELGEIEHRLRQHDAVTEVVVLAREDHSGDRKLVAYVIPAGDAVPSVRELRTYAGQALPEYMVPNFIGFVDTFPATANGKLDRAALPWPVTDRPKPTAPAPEPAAGPSLEQLVTEITAIFAERLGLPTVDPEADLWDQGATSFTMVQVSNALHERYGTRVPVSALLDEPTVASIARQLAGTQAAAPTAAIPTAAAAAPAPTAAPIPSPALPVTPVPAVVAPPATAADPLTADEVVDLFSPEQQKAFKSARHNRRPAAGEPVVPLPGAAVAPEYFGWRASRREFAPGPVRFDAFGRFLGLLAETTVEGRTRFLYPSAGDTYSVQVYVHIRPNAVEGLAAGAYYYDPTANALRLVNAFPQLDRSHHFFYNRPLFDASGFGIYLIGQTAGIKPLYQDETLRYLTLEAGYLGQTLLLGQAAAGIGLCPIGAVNHDRVTADFALDDGHVFLHGFLGGPAEHEPPHNGTRFPFGSFGATPANSGEAAGDSSRRDRKDPGEVAVIGMAGTFPGASDLGEFWRNLRAGKRATGPVPPARRAALTPGGDSGLTGGFLDRIDSFDSLLFHTSPDEARTLDPQARLLLQTVWEALENAGHTADSLRRQSGRVGVFIGTMWQDYRHVGAEAWQRGQAATVSATASDIANRISYFFDFRGPSLAVDTSCSSSLAALHLAVESIRRGECDAAVVGAANLLAHPYHLRLLDDLGLVVAGEQHAYDNTASGWAPGEGCGVVVLRPAAAATAEHDVVHGIVEGTWVGHSGRSSRFGAPNADALAESMARALAEAGRDPADIDYVECAAAGASVADAAELEALGTVFADTPKPVPVGTVKPNIGHLEAASGLSQLVKVLLQLEHGQIAPTLAAEERSALVAWHDLPLTLVDAPQPLRATAADGRVRAMVNAVGATGTYGHVLLRGPEPRTPQPGPVGARRYPVLLSAATAPALKAAARNLYDFLADRHASGTAPILAEIAYTLQTGRAHLPHRLALTVADIPELLTALRGHLAGRPVEGMVTAEVDAALAAARVEPADKYDALASWIEGYHVEWHRYWLPPSSRVSLPTYPFAVEPHWLDDGLPAVVEPEPEPEPEVCEVVRPLPREASEDTVEFVKRAYSEASGIPVTRLHPRVPLEHYGLNSQLIAKVNTLLRAEFPDAPRTLFFEHADLAGVAGALEPPGDGPDDDDEDTKSGSGSEGDWPWHGGAPSGDIAVIGVAGRYPLADDLESFWANLVSGRDCVTQLPPDRARPGWPTDLMWGGFLSDVDTFDPLLFNITPRDAELMDPQERQFLQIAWETLEDAGYTRARLAERHAAKVGVFAGVMYNEYPFFGVERTQLGTPTDTGSAVAGIANRVSYFLDLTGPSLAVDTMCSSSLTALHLAVESLRRGECEAALAGGVNLSLHPNKFIQQNRLRMNSTDHRCRAFGAGGDGFVPAEGVGAVLLKPLHRALADGDRVHAVIKGTAINHGGKTNGYMVPNPVAQGALVADALRRAGVDPATVGYLEAHGTGTELGDPVEIAGLSRAFDLPPGSCAIGSVKSNIGHPEAAAGIAALTKVILQLRHRTLAPSLHAADLNQNIDWSSSPFRVQTTAAAWEPPTTPDGRPLPRRAGVSSFGAGGANAHVVVEEFVPAPAPRADTTPQLIVLSARDTPTLRAVATRLADFLRAPATPEPDHDTLVRRLHRLADGEIHLTGPELSAYLLGGTGATAPALPPLADIAHTLQVGREPLRERLALVARDHTHLLSTLDAYLATPAHPPAATGAAAPSGPTTGASRAPVAQPHLSTPDHTPGGPVPPGSVVGAAQGVASGAGFPVTGRTPGDPVFPGSGQGPAAAGHPWVTGRTPGGSVPPGPVADAAQDLEALARHWVTGGRVDWSTLHRTRPRLTGLPSYPFDRKRYWLADEPVPLLRPDWTPTPLTPRPSEARLAIRHTAATAALAHRIAELAGGAWLVPETADVPTEAEALLDLTDLDGVDRPWQPRLAALRALIAGARGRDLRILQVTRGLLGPAGPAPTLTGAVVAAFVPLLGAEYQRVTSSVLDIDTDAPEAVLAELTAGPSGRVAVRAGTRLTQTLHPITTPPTPTKIHPDRTYLITGGTRGIGALVARHLVTRGARTLVLTGTRPPTPETRALVADLERQGARVTLHTGPLTPAFFAATRAAAPIAGVIHCAGRASAGRPSFIHKETEDLAEVLSPKVDLLHTLAANLQPDTPDFVLLFSSLSAIAPALAGGVLDYAAANAYLDLYADHQSLTGRPWFRAVDWPTWRTTGMGATAPDSSAPSGIAALTDAEGLAALDRILALPTHPRLVPARPLTPTTDPTTLIHPPHKPIPTATSPTAPGNPNLGDPGADKPDPGSSSPGSSSSNNPSSNNPSPGNPSSDTQSPGMPIHTPAAVVHSSAATTPALSPPTGNVEIGGPQAGMILEVVGEAAGTGVVPSFVDAGAEVVHSLSARASGVSVPSGSVEIGGSQGGMILGEGEPPAWLVGVFSELLGIAAEELDSTALFEDLGVESVMLAELMTAIEGRLGRRLEPGTLLENPTLRELAGALGVAGVGSAAVVGGDPLVSTVERPSAPAPDLPRPGRAPGGREIAVIGMACRFPDAPDLGAFWRNLAAKRCSVTEVPGSRWDAAEFYPGTATSKWGAFVDGIEDFDAEYFGMGAEEATCLDPTIRLFLEGTAAALADAGYGERELWGRDVGVFVGARMSNYRERTGARGGAAGMGTDQNFVAARVSHQFNFHGPNMVVDSACSSSLVGIQLACRSLLDGESEVAVAGGVDVLLDEQPYLEFSAAGALSPDGRCFTFDERANGFVPGEGCGVLLLKTLDRALSDGDRVHAVIRAVAVNNDGHTMGLTTPNPAAQAKVVQRALDASGLGARDIGLVEAHGTGTMIGDPIEVRALTDVYRRTTADTAFCAIGSVKSNIGHLLSAAGMAGVLKVVLALKHRQLPPTLFCETPNPRFDFAASPFTPNTELRAWESAGPRAAAVSAFGLGGTNAHLIATEHVPTTPPTREPLPAPVFRRTRHWLDRPHPPTPRRQVGTAQAGPVVGRQEAQTRAAWPQAPVTPVSGLVEGTSPVGFPTAPVGASASAAPTSGAASWTPGVGGADGGSPPGGAVVFAGAVGQVGGAPLNPVQPGGASAQDSPVVELPAQGGLTASLLTLTFAHPRAEG